MINVYYRVASIEIWAYCERPKGTYWSPSGGVKLTITDPEGTVKLDGAAMNPEATGKFLYTYNTPADGVKGWWHGTIIGQDGSGEGARYGRTDFSFELK